MEPPLLAKVTFATIFEKTLLSNLKNLHGYFKSCRFSFFIHRLLVACKPITKVRSLQVSGLFQTQKEEVGVPREQLECINLLHISSGVCVEMESEDINRFKERSHLWGWYFYMSALHRFWTHCVV